MLNVEWKHRPAVIQHSTFNIEHSTFAFLRAFIVCAFVTTSAFAQISFGGASNIPGQDLVKLTGSVTERHATEVKGVVTATIQSGWHINSNNPLEVSGVMTAASLTYYANHGFFFFSELYRSERGKTPLHGGGSKPDPCLAFSRNTAIWSRVTASFRQYPPEPHPAVIPARPIAQT